MPIAIAKYVEMYGRRLIVVETYKELGTKEVKSVPISTISYDESIVSAGEQVIALIGSRNNTVIIEPDNSAKEVFDYITEVITKHRLTESLNIVEKVYS